MQVDDPPLASLFICTLSQISTRDPPLASLFICILSQISTRVFNHYISHTSFYSVHPFSPPPHRHYHRHYHHHNTTTNNTTTTNHNHNHHHNNNNNNHHHHHHHHQHHHNHHHQRHNHNHNHHNNTTTTTITTTTPSPQQHHHNIGRMMYDTMRLIIDTNVTKTKLLFTVSSSFGNRKTIVQCVKNNLPKDLFDASGGTGVALLSRKDYLLRAAGSRFALAPPGLGHSITLSHSLTYSLTHSHSHSRTISHTPSH